MKTATKGFFFNDEISYDEHKIVLKHHFLQSPFTLVPFKWGGFVGNREETFEFDENLYYFFNTGKLGLTKTLFLSQEGRYSTLPTKDEDSASDDQDDFTFQRLNDGIGTKDAIDQTDRQLLQSSADNTIQVPLKNDDEDLIDGTSYRVAMLDKDEVHSVTWNIPIWSLFGTIVKEGESNNIRKDQGGVDYVMIKPDLSMFCYKYFGFFSGSLRDFLKTTTGSFNRVYSNYKF